MRIQVRHHDGVTFLTLSGTMDDRSDLAPLTSELLPVAVVDLADIQRITSPGIRAWGHFIAAAEARGATLVMVRCCPVAVEQINLVRGFLGRGVVKSFYAPYTCSRCGLEERLLLECRQVADGKAPAFGCPRCNEPMIFDSIEDSYFGFLEDPKKVVGDDRFDAITPPEPTPAGAVVPSLTPRPAPPPAAGAGPSTASEHEMPPVAPSQLEGLAAAPAAPPATATSAPTETAASAPAATATAPAAAPRSTTWLAWLVVVITVATALVWLL